VVAAAQPLDEATAGDDRIPEEEKEQFEEQLGAPAVAAMRKASVPQGVTWRHLWCTKGKPRRISGVLWCPHCKLSGNRDKLATINQTIVFLALISGLARPVQYRWAPADPRLAGGKKRTAAQLREDVTLAQALFDSAQRREPLEQALADAVEAAVDAGAVEVRWRKFAWPADDFGELARAEAAQAKARLDAALEALEAEEKAAAALVSARRAALAAKKAPAKKAPAKKPPDGAAPAGAAAGGVVARTGAAQRRQRAADPPAEGAATPRRKRAAKRNDPGGDKPRNVAAAKQRAKSPGGPAAAVTITPHHTMPRQPSSSAARPAHEAGP
jgi:hypothetical protein